ncbi:hypothetical protein vseg_000958 [Gypsophila vaccaria]
MWAEKRRREGGDAGSFRQKRGRYSQPSPRPRYLGATRSVSGGRVATSPVAHGAFSGGYGEGARGRVFGCRRCSKNHPGRLCDGRPMVCFECGREGHRSFECRQGRYAWSRLGASSYAPTASTGSVAPLSDGRPFGGAVSRGVGGSFARGPSGGGRGDHFGGGFGGSQYRGGFVGGRASGDFGAGQSSAGASGSRGGAGGSRGGFGGGHGRGQTFGRGGGSYGGGPRPASLATTVQEGVKNSGQLYALTREEAQSNAHVVTGTFLINSRPTFVLFDSGASHSFVSCSVLSSLGLDVFDSIDDAVVTPVEEYVVCDHMCRSVSFLFAGIDMPIDLFVFPLAEFGVIVGMD